jgi:hypothetical protein
MERRKKQERVEEGSRGKRKRVEGATFARGFGGQGSAVPWNPCLKK